MADSSNGDDPPVGPAGQPDFERPPVDPRRQRPDFLPPRADDEDDDAAEDPRHTYRDNAPSNLTVWLVLGGAALAVLLIVAAIGVVSLTGGPGLEPPRVAAPSEEPHTRPSPPNALPPSTPPAGSLPDFDGRGSRSDGRIDDPAAGLSYAELGSPWRTGVEGSRSYTARQYIVTERSDSIGSEWFATIASEPLPPEFQRLYEGPDSLRGIAELQARRYLSAGYPPDADRRDIAGEEIDIDGHRGWLIGVRLAFQTPEFDVRGETAVVVAVDTGAGQPGILFACVPDTHKELRPDINKVVDSLKVLD